ncbi:MAG: sugar phosphate isomerase/epimerase [Proteobacteria bacterium]|nr:sugar phosphate isomerase/epimerase [Pseudomonadota bacterium]
MQQSPRRVPIRIGNQTSFAASSVGEPFDYAIEHGFDAFEWFPDRPDRPEIGLGWEEGDLDAGQRLQLRSAAHRHGVQQSVHAPWRATPLQPGGPERLQQSVELALDLGATLINLHLDLSQGIEAFAEATAHLAQQLARHRLALAIENTPETSPEHFNALFALLRAQFGTQRAGMCLDLGHANLYGGTRNDYLAYVDRLADHVPLIHLHLHENYGDRDSHLTLFTGPAAQSPAGLQGLIARLRARGFAGAAILEQWPRPPRLLNEARDRLCELLGQPRARAWTAWSND